MAIYRLAADIVRRSEGRTVTAAAAYRAGELIADQRTGLLFDYRRRQGVTETLILAPATAPAWMRDRARLWNAVETVEKRKDAQLARDIELALPHELSPAQRRELVRCFVQAAFVDAGMVADVALHAPDRHGDTRNHHAHILVSLRVIEGGGFGRKERSWNETARLEQWRALWADHVNQALAAAGEQARVDHRSLEAQGIERLAQIHLGRAVIEMRRQGIVTERAELAGAIDAVNGELASGSDSRRAHLTNAAALGAPVLPAGSDERGSAAGCTGACPLPSVLYNTPLALLPEGPQRTERLPLFRHVAGELVRRVRRFLKRPRPGELPRPGRDTLDGHRRPRLYRGMEFT